MDKRDRSIDLLTLRNVRLCMFPRIRIGLIGSEMLMLKHTYINYIHCHYD